MAEASLLSERDGATALLILNRPQTRNALDNDLLDALSKGLRAAAEDPAVRCIVLTGSGGSFCAGADLKAAMAGGAEVFDRVEAAVESYHAVVRAIVEAPKPVLAAVDGPAVGFGCDLALACDLRIASTEAYFQEKFVKIGLMPDGGGTFWLPRLIGLARAMEMMLSGEPMRAGRALEIGLVNRVVAPDALRAEALAWAGRLAKGPPIAFEEIKRAVRLGLGGTIEGTLEAEKKGQVRCLRSSDCMEGVMAWMQKREPDFKGQ